MSNPTVTVREELTAPRGAGLGCGGGAVANVSDPARAAAQQVPRLGAVVASKHGRLNVAAAESQPYARRRHQRRTTERCNNATGKYTGFMTRCTAQTEQQIRCEHRKAEKHTYTMHLYIQKIFTTIKCLVLLFAFFIKS